MKSKIIDCCIECGNKRYKITREEMWVYKERITVHIRVCPICLKKKMIIPASDWQWMMGDDSKWD